jgi:hypothetical protein
VVGQEFYIYAALKPGEGPRIPSRFKALGAEVGGLPTGVIVGKATISHCTPPTKGRIAKLGRGKAEWSWHLTNVKRLKRPFKPRRQPMPSWFNPF